MIAVSVGCTDAVLVVRHSILLSHIRNISGSLRGTHLSVSRFDHSWVRGIAPNAASIEWLAENRFAELMRAALETASGLVLRRAPIAEQFAPV
jgi:hypothetical protein